MAERRIEPLVYRTISFEASAFDKLKELQRRMEGERGRPLTNSEVVAELFRALPPVPPRDH